MNIDKSEYEKLQTELASVKEENQYLKQQLAILNKAVFGQKTEKTKAVLENQQCMFDEADFNQSVNEQKDEEELCVTGYSRKKKRTREEIFKDLPVEEEVIDSEDISCPECGNETEIIGKEKVRDEIVYVPSKVYMKTIYRTVRKCSVCGSDETLDSVKDDNTKNVIMKADVPASVLPKSFCSPELLSYIIYEKYFKAVPLERLSKQFTEKGCPLSTQTLSNWVIAAAKIYFRPIYDELHGLLLKEQLIHADETVVQVLQEEGRKAKTQSRMWVYCAGAQAEHQIRLYEYRPTRAKTNAEAFLSGFSGYLVCDGYAGYNGIPGITRCGCWAHLRRKFREAIPDDAEIARTSQARVGFEYCNKLYALEKEYTEKNLTAEEIAKRRLTDSMKTVGDFYLWAEGLQISGRTKLSEAIGYALSQKKALMQFLNNPIIPIDNNIAERTVKPFVIGRRNWLFSTSVKGADASAWIYSVITTANTNGLNVQDYLTRLFKERKNELPF